jgi:dephospho-CoA kinase
MRKLIGEDVWVRYLFDKIDAIDAADTVIGVDLRAIITDLRQPNEYERCRAECYVIIRVSCPDDIRLERARSAGDVFTAEDLRHETESYVDTFAVDYEIDNSGSLAELYAKVDEVMAKINVRKTEGIR